MVEHVHTLTSTDNDFICVKIGKGSGCI